MSDVVHETPASDGPVEGALPDGAPAAGTPGGAPTEGAPATPPGEVLDGVMPVRAVDVVRRRAWDYLAPMGIVAVLSALVTVVATVVDAWTTPTMLRDHAFVSTSASPSGATLTVLGVAVVVLGALTARATLVAALLAAGDLLGRPVALAGARAEVRRRRGLWAAWTALLLVAAMVTGVVVPAVLTLTGWLLGLPALALACAALELLTRWVTVAACHGVGLGAAARRMGDLRRAWPQDVRVRFRRPPGVFLVVLALPVASVAWAVGEGADRLLAPWAEAVALATAAALAVPVPVLLVVGMVGVHLRITRFVARYDSLRLEPLPWSGVDRASAAGAAPSEPGTVEAPAPARGSWRVAVVRVGAAVAALLVAPAAHLLVVETNPTPAPDPVVLRWADDYAAPFVLPDGEDVILLARWGGGLSRCDLDDTRCRVASMGGLPRTWNATTLSATDDPDGRGLAYLIRMTQCTDEELTDCERYTALVTCEVEDCFGDDGAAGRTVTEVAPDASTGDLAAQGGRYAVVTLEAVGDDADDEASWFPDRQVLRVCESAACRDPQTYDLGPADLFDVGRVAFAPDGRVWVARLDLEQERMRVMTAAPGDAGLTDAFDVELPPYGDRAVLGPSRGLLRLAVRDDGTPVLVHRDPGTEGLVLTSCEDALCAERTTTALPFSPFAASGADLAVDGTDRPILATTGVGLVMIHSCADRACTRMSSAPISDGRPIDGDESDAPTFLTLDPHGRPVVAVEEHIPNPDDPYPGYWLINRVLWCREARCGL